MSKCETKEEKKIRTWSSQGRSITNDNFGISRDVVSATVKDFCLKEQIKVPLCDFFSNPVADKKYYYVSTDQTYINGTIDSFGVWHEPVPVPNVVTQTRASGYIFKICRKSLQVVQTVRFEDLTGKQNDACRYSPVLHGKYLYVASSVMGKSGTLLCLKKKDLTKVVWKRELTPNSAFGISGANCIVVDLCKLPDPAHLGKTGFDHACQKDVICRRRDLMKKHPKVLFIGTSSLEEINYILPDNCPLQNGQFYCIDACDGTVVWKKDMLPSQYVQGDALRLESFRFDETTNQPVEWIFGRASVTANTTFIPYSQTGAKTINQIRLFPASQYGNTTKTVVFFHLGTSGDALPSFLVNQTVSLSSDTNTVSVTLGTTVPSAHEGESGYIIVDTAVVTNLVSILATPGNFKYYVLEALKVGDLLSWTEAFSVNYSGSAVWGSPVVFDPLRWQIVITTGNNYSMPLDEIIYYQNIDHNIQGNVELEDYTAGLLNNIVDALNTYGVASSQYAAANAALQARIVELEKKRAHLSPRGKLNNINSIISLDCSNGDNVWVYRATTYDVWTLGALIKSHSVHEAVALSSPWGPDADFGMGIHIYRCEKTKNDVYVGVSKGGILVSLSANTGSQIHRLLIGPYEAIGACNYGSATDGKHFYATVKNGSLGVDGFRVYYDQVNPTSAPNVFYASGQSYVYKYDPFKGHICWTAPITDMTASRPMVCNDVLFVPDLNGFLRMYRTNDGFYLGHLILPSSGFASPLILDDTMVVAPGYHKVSGSFPPGSNFQPANSILFYKIKDVYKHTVTTECVKPRDESLSSSCSDGKKC